MWQVDRSLAREPQEAKTNMAHQSYGVPHAARRASDEQASHTVASNHDRVNCKPVSAR